MIERFDFNRRNAERRHPAVDQGFQGAFFVPPGLAEPCFSVADGAATLTDKTLDAPVFEGPTQIS
jgi:hypothetical protein